MLLCCIRKDTCIKRKLSYFGGRMCENQCCVVALAFQPFLSFSKKFDICVQISVLHCCVTAFHLFPQKFYMCGSRSVLHCCMRKDSCKKKKIQLFLMVECGCVKISVALLRQPFLNFFQKSWPSLAPGCLAGFKKSYVKLS